MGRTGLGVCMDTNMSQYSVALLMSDLNEAKNITAVFKQLGIVPFICKTEADFFIQCENEKPHFSVIDVKKLSQSFVSHELIQNDSLALTFFYNLGSKKLLPATYDIFNYGQINGHQELAGQVKSILNRFNHVDRFRVKSSLVENVEKHFDDKMKRIVTQVEKLKEKDFYQTFFKSICARLENEKTSADDFLTATARVFNTIKEVKCYTYLELAPSGHKLVSPKVYFDKYKEVPSLWLGRSSTEGIEFFAQNMASQVCLELIGGDLMSLLVKGQENNPDLMLFMQVEDEDFINHFDWETFEIYLSGLYQHYKLRERAVGGQVAERSNVWSLFTFVDELSKGALPGSQIDGSLEHFSLLTIDFDLLMTKATEKPQERFYWQKFFDDFFNGLEAKKKISFKLYPYSLSQVVLLVDKKEEEQTKKEIEAYSKRFPFWRYFEQADLALKDNMVPTVRYTSMSVMSLVNELVRPSKQIAEPLVLEERPLSSRSAPTQSM
jgi:hypothetical protein